jgi:tetratricopeptide (TPR) repeat protein
MVERNDGPNHPNLAPHLDRLGMLYYLEKRYADAETVYRRSLAIWENLMGADNPELATTLENLAVAYASQDKFSEAAALYRRSLALREKLVVSSSSNLAMTLEGQGQDAAAERQFKLALGIAESSGDAESLAKVLGNYAALLHKLKRETEAKRLEDKARALRKPEKP